MDSLDYIIIVGCGQLGANIANTLSASGGSVLVVDTDKDAFRRLSPAYAGSVMTGDATDLAVLAEARAETAAAVVAVTSNDNINIMVAQLIKELYGTPHVIARLYDPDRDRVYQEFGIETISPVLLSTAEVYKLLKLPEA